jgi:hypothetical protein
VEIPSSSTAKTTVKKKERSAEINRDLESSCTMHRDDSISDHWVHKLLEHITDRMANGQDHGILWALWQSLAGQITVTGQGRLEDGPDKSVLC